MQGERSLFKRLVTDPALAILALILYTLFRTMRLSSASALGGVIARFIGPHLTIHQHAIENLKLAFPEKSEPEIATIALGMWNNLGRFFGECPHLGKINVYDPAGSFEVIGAEYIDLLRDDGKPGIFFSGHLANWEIVPLSATQRGVPIDRIYRAANNNLIERLYQHGRSFIQGELIPKGPEGARKILKSLKEGRHIGILVDQKMNDGIPVPFFGRDAMTAPALAELALRYNCPVVPTRAERIKGSRFRIIIEPPLDFTPSGDRKADVAAMMKMVNEKLEYWIRKTPEQWFWVHNRWPR